MSNLNFDQYQAPTVAKQRNTAIISTTTATTDKHASKGNTVESAVQESPPQQIIQTPV